MYNYEIVPYLKIILEKLSRKDRTLYSRVMDKIQEIINSDNIEHYKNLKYHLKDSKRVHVGHFVLVFQFNKSTNTIIFDDFNHHDNIYE